MKTLCIIPAKSTSKRLPGKNLKPFFGKPVIEYTLEAVKGFCEKTVVTTDDDKTGSLAAAHGAVYYKRSPETTRDDSPMVDAVLEVLHDDAKYDYVLMAYPCAPFISREDIATGLALIEQGPDIVFPVFRDDNYVERSFIEQNDRLRPRYPEYNNINSQGFSTTYHSAGQWYWARTDYLLEHRSFVSDNMRGMLLDSWRCIDIDTHDDWKRAELVYMLTTETDRLEWLKEHRPLIDWLATAEEKMDYGTLEITYAEGQIRHIDIRPRERHYTME